MSSSPLSRSRPGALRRESRAAESTRETLEAVRERVRSARFNAQSNAASKMVNSHSAAYANNPDIEYDNANVHGDHGDPHRVNNIYTIRHANLSNLGGPTNRSTKKKSNGTEYATIVSHVPKGFADRGRKGAIRGHPKKPEGGARKKTRKNKKESRKSRKLRKSRK
jgi:hypothetical protein